MSGGSRDHHYHLSFFTLLDEPNTRITISLSVLTWLVWDSVILAGREYEDIWRRESSIATRFYLCSRYLGLVAQTVNTICTIHLLSQEHVPSEICRAWLVPQIIVGHMLYSGFQVILMLRVYALYNRSKSVGAALFSLRICETAALVFCTVQMSREFHFMPICLVEETPPIVAGVCTTIMLTQIIIWGMTFLKQIDTKYQNHPLMYVISRDGAVACTAFIGFFATVMPYTPHIHAPIDSYAACFMSLISILTCRMILNMQSFTLDSTSTFLLHADVDNERPRLASGHESTYCLDTLCEDFDMDITREPVSQWSWMREGQPYVADM